MGPIPFHAPKAAGQFVFRVFDMDNSSKTVATSPMFQVVLMDYDVTK
jgi:hypothetical protein